MPSVSAKAAAKAGKTGGSAQVSLTVGLGVLAVAGALAYLATKSAGPIPMPKFTESRQGPLMEHIVTKEELGLIPADPRVHFPQRVAPGTAFCVKYGFSPLYQIPDATAAALPAEEMW